jgi:hypothetical protein
MSALTPYEHKVLRELRAWQAQQPGWGTRLLAKPAGKVAQLAQVLVPTEALRAALDGTNALGSRFSGDRSVLKRAGVGNLAELREQQLELCDRLSRTELRRAMAMGGVGGAAFGLAGAAGLIADVPSLLTLAFRTLHKVGLCYGEDLRARHARHMALGLFALVSANSMEEKQSALAALQRGDDASLVDAAWRDGVERVAERELAKEATVYSLQNLAARVGLNLGKRKAASAIPLLGAAVGAAVNAWYLADAAQTARYVFQERWLAAKYPHLEKPAALTGIASK